MFLDLLFFEVVLKHGRYAVFETRVFVFVVSGTLINFLDVFMLNTRRVGLMCSVRYCAVILSHSIYILLFLA